MANLLINWSDCIVLIYIIIHPKYLFSDTLGLHVFNDGFFNRAGRLCLVVLPVQFVYLDPSSGRSIIKDGLIISKNTTKTRELN